MCLVHCMKSSDRYDSDMKNNNYRAQHLFDAPSLIHYISGISPYPYSDGIPSSVAGEQVSLAQPFGVCPFLLAALAYSLPVG